jgi:hypothetical protein
MKIILFIFLIFSIQASAESKLPMINQDMDYKEAKIVLMKDGWKPLTNRKISQSSLYAQELYEQGLTEVVDCISMELDGCWFYYTKKNQRLEVRTITKALKIDQIKLN